MPSDLANLATANPQGGESWCFMALQQLRSLAPGYGRKITRCRQLKVCSNYRGINLLSIAGKVVTTILRIRMHDHYEAKLRERQGGRRCINQIFALRPILECQMRYGKPSVICFIDFAAGFDSVHSEALWEEILGNCGLADLFIDILKDLYSGFSTSCVRTLETAYRHRFR